MQLEHSFVLGNDTGSDDSHVDHVHFTRRETAGVIVHGLEAHGVLRIEGVVATQDQVAARGVASIQIAQVQGVS